MSAYYIEKVSILGCSRPEPNNTTACQWSLKHQNILKIKNTVLNMITGKEKLLNFLTENFLLNEIYIWCLKYFKIVNH